MKEVIVFGITTIFAVAGFILLLIVGLLRKRKNLVLLSFLSLLISLLLGALTGYKIVAKSYTSLSEIFEPRTGDEVYSVLFGRPLSGCVKIKHYQDQVLPKIDYAIWLHVKTCSSEMRRILGKRIYSLEKASTKDMASLRANSNKIWFNPELLGDSILIFSNFNESGNGQAIYSNLDSTEVFIQDIYD